MPLDHTDLESFTLRTGQGENDLLLVIAAPAGFNPNNLGKDAPIGTVLFTPDGAFQKIGLDDTDWTEGNSIGGPPVPEGLKKFKIYEYVRRPGQYDPTEFPGCINYKTGLLRRLYPLYNIVHGELIKTTYYGEYDEQTKVYSEPVLFVEATYSRPNGVAVKSRTATINYYYTDGTLCPEVKICKKFFNSHQAIAELKRRRNNVTNQLELEAVGYIAAFHNYTKTESEVFEEGAAWASTYSQEIHSYIHSGDMTIAQRLNADAVTGWLNHDYGTGRLLKHKFTANVDFKD